MPSLQTLLKRGFTPTLESINQFLLYLSQKQIPNYIITFFSQLNSNKVKLNSQTRSIFTWALLKLHKFDEAEQFIITQMVKSSTFHKISFWDSLVQEFCNNRKDPEKALQLLDDCLKIPGMVPSSFTFCSFIHCFSSQGNMSKAIEVLELMTNEKYVFDNFVCSSVVSGFCKIGKPELALQFFENAVKTGGLRPNIVAYTALVAFSLFKKLEDTGIEMDEFVYAILIDGFCRVRNLDLVFHLLDDMEKKGIKPSIITYNTVINGLCKVGRTSEADDITTGLHTDVVTYSTLLHGYIEEENLQGILKTKQQLEEAGCQMDIVMCNVLIKALFMVGAFEEIYVLHQTLPEMGLSADPVTYCTLIDGFCKFSRIEEALEAFDEFRRTPFSPVPCYNSIITGLCKNDMVDMAIELFIELCEKDLVLDVRIFRTLVDATLAEGTMGALNLASRILETIYITFYVTTYSKSCVKGVLPKLRVSCAW